MPNSCAGEAPLEIMLTSDAPAGWLRTLAERLRAQSDNQLRRTLRERRPDLIDLATNDYLRLRSHPHLIDRVRAAASEWGVGAGASRLIAGTMELHTRVEARLAAFKGAEAALVLPTGYMANLALLSALPQPGDLILMDRLNHASLIDAATLSAGRGRHSGAGGSPIFRRFHHRDLNHARQLALRHLERTHGATIWLISDSVFSMDGDIADIKGHGAMRDDLNGHSSAGWHSSPKWHSSPSCAPSAQPTGTHERTKRPSCCLILDEAHATGLIGPTGAGADEAAGHLADICVSTASKALGSLGGIITGPRLVIDAVTNFARPFIFTTAVPPTQLAAIDAALDVIEREPQRRERMADLARTLRAALVEKGWPADSLGDDPTPIVPLIVGEPEQAIALSAMLEKAGFLAPAIRPPSVPQGTSRVRVSVHAGLSGADVERLIAAIPKRG